MGLFCSKASTNYVERRQEGDIMFGCARGQVKNNLKELGSYLPLYKASVRGNWDEASKFLDNDPQALSAKITNASETALHLAVGAVTKKNFDFIETLIRRMSAEDLALTDQNGETALSVAAAVGNLEAAKLLVNKNPDLPNIAGKSGLPIHRAAQYGKEKMIEYLLEVTRSDIEPSPFTGTLGAQLLNSIIVADFFDVAQKLVEQYPDIATIEVQGLEPPLTVLASKSTAFPSGGGVTLTRLQQQTYNPVKYIRQCQERKRKQRQVILLVRSLCTEILLLDDAKAFELLREPLLIAAELGTHEIIEEIVDAFPPAIWAADDENRNIFELAVLHRRENVFSLIYQMSNYRFLITRYADKHDNNILHLAGHEPSRDRLRLVSGAAFQVQRELLWFKEVERIVEPSQKDSKNKDGLTPWMVFREEHKEIMKEGEKWMKNTATAGTVASTLITTVAFSAIIHYPGGDDGDGHPKFIGHWPFTAFVLAVGISLFTSLTAIILFLTILTFRYSEKDFLKALPWKLTSGLMMLSISIISMTVAFGATIFLLFGTRTAIIVTSVAATIVFVHLGQLMLPLLIPTMKYIYFDGLFRKKTNRTLLH